MVEHTTVMAVRAAFAAVFAMLLAASSGCSPSSNQSAPAADLVGSWSFGEGAGEKAYDTSPYGNTATLNRVGWGTGRVGTALAFDGGNDSIVSVPLAASLRRTAEAITVAAWTYRDAEHNVAVVSHGYPALFFGFHGPRFKWQVTLQSGRQRACYAEEKYVAGLGRWIHIAASYDGWAVRLYADGREICRKWAWGPLAMPETPFTIGGYLDGSGRIVDEMSGRIDEVRIYSRALSAAEIRQLAHTPATAIAGPPPVAVSSPHGEP